LPPQIPRHTRKPLREETIDCLLYIISANRNSRNPFREDISHSWHNSKSYVSKEKFNAALCELRFFLY